MSRALLICPEPVRSVTAGVGTRFVALAGVLSDHGHEVTLLLPNDPDEARDVGRGVRVLQADPDRLGAQADGHDWVLLHGHLGNHYLAQRDDLPVVVDLYDPFLIENLHYHRELGLEPFHTDHATWRLQMGRGDLFLCSSEEQRLYYLGWLTALGRVNPLTLDGDPTLRRLLVPVPFGVPPGDPPPPPPRREVLPDVPDDAPLLYFGGVYDWYDVDVLLRAMPVLLERDPGTTVVFVDHPHPELTPQSAAGRARAEAERRGWLGREIRFEGWRPPQRRHVLPLVSDLAVVTHVPGVETDLSLRTRLVDLLWLGLPVVVTAGGTMARVVEREGCGVVVRPGDPAALARGVATVLDDGDRRREMAARGRRWACSRCWPEVAAPLLEFARRPWRDPHRDRFAGLAPPDVRGSEPLIARLARRLRKVLG